jgi:Flp pilus assembly protein TadG
MLNNLLRSRDGGVMVTMALAALGIIGATGLAVDIGRSQMVQAKLQNAVDAAGLAAGATVNTTDLTAVATKYINLNFSQGTLGATRGTVVTTLSTDKQIVTVSTSATLPTTIMKIFGRNTVTVSASTEVTRANVGMEVALVLDITGSMWTNNNHLKQRAAAAAMMDVLYGTRDVVPNLWVSVIPYVTSVNISSQTKATQWLTNYDLSKYPPSYPNNQVKWKGCVEERATPLDVSDDVPVAGTDAYQ